MGSHPINLAVRFILELTAIFVYGLWGWRQADGGLRIVLMLLIPIVFATVWGIFNVPGDPSRSGAAPVVVPGIVRLLLELVFFGLACWALHQLDLKTYALIFGAVVILHYLVSYDRITWLLSK